jgi:hypothetical protein
MCEAQAAAEPDGEFEGLIGVWLTIHHHMCIRSNGDIESRRRDR